MAHTGASVIPTDGITRTNGVAGSALDVSDEHVIVGEGVALDVRPAGFLLRAASSLIDAVAVLLASGAVFYIVMQTLVAIERSGTRLELAVVMAVIITTQVLTLVGLPCLVETVTHGKSLGRFIMRLRIVRDDGGATGFRHAFVRALVGFFEFWMTSGGIAILVGLLHPRAKRLGDVLAGTYSQNEAAPKLAPNVGPVPYGLEAWAATADVSRIPDRAARRMRDYLSQAPRLEPGARTRVAGSVAREIKDCVHPIPDVDADTFLRAVAAVRRDREYAAMQLRASRRAALEPMLERLPHGFPQRG